MTRLSTQIFCDDLWILTNFITMFTTSKLLNLLDHKLWTLAAKSLGLVAVHDGVHRDPFLELLTLLLLWGLQWRKATPKIHYNQKAGFDFLSGIPPRDSAPKKSILCKYKIELYFVVLIWTLWTHPVLSCPQTVASLSVVGVSPA